MDTPEHLLALLVTPADEQDRAQVKELAPAVRKVTGQSIELAFVDQGYTGEAAAAAAAAHGLRLEVVKLAEAKRSFVLLPAALSSSSAVSRGRRGSAAWLVITKGCLRQSLACIFWPSQS